MSNEYRGTTVAGEALHSGVAAPIVVTSFDSEVLYSLLGPVEAKVSVYDAETLHVGEAILKISGYDAESLHSGNAVVKISSTVIELLESIRVRAYPTFLAPPRLLPLPLVERSLSSTTARPTLITELNPYAPTAPVAIADTSPVLHTFMEEQAQTLRQQHNLIQTGGSTYPWEVITTVTTDRQYTLGSVGRFYNNDYGMIQARYVQFRGMIYDAKWPGTPVGYYFGTPSLDWIVTNDFSKSGPTGVVGFSTVAAAIADDYYGWVAIDGPNVYSAQVDPAAVFTEGDPLVWSKTGFVANTGSGLVFGRVRKAGPAYDLPAGSVKFGLEGESIDGALEPVKASMTALRVTVANTNTAVAAVQADVANQTTQITAGAAATDAVDAKVTTESQARQAAVRTTLLNARADKRALLAKILAGDNAVTAAFKAADLVIRTYVDDKLALLGVVGDSVASQFANITASITTFGKRLDALQMAVGAEKEFRIVYSFTGAPPVSVLLDSFTFDTSIQILATAPGAIFRCVAAPTANTTWTLSQNGTPVATILFTSAGLIGAVTWALDIDFVAGDHLDIFPPAALNGMLGFYFTLIGRYA